MKKLLLALVVTAGVAGVVSPRLSKLAPAPPREEYPTAAVEFGAIREVVSVTGVVQPKEVFAVAADQPGRVVRVFADVHQAVKLHEPLAQLDDRIAQLRLSQAKLGVELALAEVTRAEAARDNAQLAVTRATELASKGGFQSDLTQANGTLRMAEAGVKAAVTKVREAQVGVSLAEQALDLTVVRSPAAGVVIDRKCQVGQAALGPLFAVATDLRQMQLTALVPEADAGKLRVGMPAAFTVNAHPDEPPFTGAVLRVLPSPVGGPGAVQYAAQVDVANRTDPATNEPRLRPGMPAAVDLVARHHDGVWKVPLAATTVTIDDAKLSPPAQAKLARWAGRGDRADWQRVWTLDADHRPWPVFLRVAGAGGPAIQDGQFQEVLAWDSEEPAPAPGSAPRVVTGLPAGSAAKAAMKFF